MLRGMSAPPIDREHHRALLMAVLPLAHINVPGLYVFSAALVLLGGERLDRTDALVWLGFAWFTTTGQGALILTRSWWWRRWSLRSWEVTYAVLEIGIGTTWGAAVLIGPTPGHDFDVTMMIVAFLMTTTAAGVVAFAGSTLIGRAFLVGQWTTFSLVAASRGEWSMVVLSLVVLLAAIGYLEVTSYLLSRAIAAQLQTEELARELQRQASTDALTGLPNRPAVIDALDEMLGGGHDVVVLFVDLDDFKDVNDGLGHDRGDEVLAEVGRRLRTTVRADDVVGRLGGDEFVVLLAGPLSVGGANHLAQRLTDVIAEPIGSTPAVTVGASIGLTVGRHGTTARELLRQADLAMYSAKEGGGGDVTAYQSFLADRRTRQLALARELPLALADGRISAHAQPVVALNPPATFGCELLARWTLDDGTAIPPAIFVPLAERLGLDRRLGCLMLEHAAAAVASTGLVFGVNVTARHLLSGRLADDITAVAARHGADLDQMAVEITESQVVSDIEVAAAEIGRLQQLGVRVAIDDFGTGHSTLSLLDRVPAGYLKMAPEFGLRMQVSERARILVRTVAAMAVALDVNLILEGIETADVASMAVDAGVRFGQGYHFARPAPLDVVLCGMRPGHRYEGLEVAPVTREMAP